MDRTLITAQAASDEQVIALWLHSKSTHSQRAYVRDIVTFRNVAGVPLAQVTLGTLQNFADDLEAGGLAPASRSRTLAAVKSLLTFAGRIGFLPFNVGAALPPHRLRDQLARRILPESDLQRVIALETNVRDRALLRFLYATGGRVSEICGLTWNDLQPAGDGEGIVTIFGKGAKTRNVRLPASIWTELQALRGTAALDAPVFQSARSSKPLDPSRVMRIVGAAAKRAGLEQKVGPHWLRHCHASHVLDRGASIALVQATLGHASIETTGRYLHARPTESSGKCLAV